MSYIMKEDLTPETLRWLGLEALRKARVADQRAKQIRKDVKDQAWRHLQRQAHLQLGWWARRTHPIEEMPVDRRLWQSVVDSWLGNNMQWKAAIADNRWYLDQATAYGVNAHEEG